MELLIGLIIGSALAVAAWIYGNKKGEATGRASATDESAARYAAMQSEVEKTIEDAQGKARAIVTEAKDEAIKLREGADKDVKERRNEISREEDRQALLAAATHERPLFLLLGPPPLDEDSLEGCEEGLQAFVTEALPALLRNARVRHPVRGLLCVQHHEDRSLVDRILGWPQKTAPGLRPCVLPPLTLPGRQDIVEYLDRYHPPLPATVKQRVLGAYDRMVERRRTLTFEDLTRLLDQHLDQYAGVAPP